MADKDDIIIQGAKMKCTMGDMSSNLKVTSQFKYKMHKKKVATMFDFAPGANLRNPVTGPVGVFGTCKPYKMLPPPAQLCTPIPVSPWMPALIKKKVGMKPVIQVKACLFCARGGGIIKFEDAGQ